MYKSTPPIAPGTRPHHPRYSVLTAAYFLFYVASVLECSLIIYEIFQENCCFTLIFPRGFWERCKLWGLKSSKPQQMHTNFFLAFPKVSINILVKFQSFDKRSQNFIRLIRKYNVLPNIVFLNFFESQKGAPTPRIIIPLKLQNYSLENCENGFILAYFSKYLIKPCVLLLGVWAKNAICRKFIRKRSKVNGENSLF